MLLKEIRGPTRGSLRVDLGYKAVLDLPSVNRGDSATISAGASVSSTDVVAGAGVHVCVS